MRTLVGANAFRISTGQSTARRSWTSWRWREAQTASGSCLDLNDCSIRLPLPQGQDHSNDAADFLGFGLTPASVELGLMSYSLLRVVLTVPSCRAEASHLHRRPGP